MNASDFNEHAIPPGGWQFYSPQTGWWAPSPVAFTLEQQATNLVRHRKANLAVAQRHKLATDFASCYHEVRAYNAKRLNVQVPSPPKLPAPPTKPYLAEAAVRGVAAVRKLAAGMAVLLEWEQSGEPPVTQEVANQRAEICTACPLNDAGGLSAHFTIPVAERIRREFEKMHKLNLNTPLDDKLHVCSACLCPLRLKAWVPMHLIQKRLKPDQKIGLDARCWIRNGI